MKKILFSAIAMAFASTANADGYTWLNLRLTDGTEQSLTAEGLKIVYSGGNLVATTSDGQTSTVALSELSAMYFSNSQTTGITSAAAQQGISVSDGYVYVTASEDSEVTIVNTAGIIVGKRTIASGSTEAVGSKLPSGVYIIKVNNTTTKICIN